MRLNAGNKIHGTLNTISDHKLIFKKTRIIVYYNIIIVTLNFARGKLRLVEKGKK